MLSGITVFSLGWRTCVCNESLTILHHDHDQPERVTENQPKICINHKNGAKWRCSACHRHQLLSSVSRFDSFVGLIWQLLQFSIGASLLLFSCVTDTWSPSFRLSRTALLFPSIRYLQSGLKLDVCTEWNSSDQVSQTHEQVEFIKWKGAVKSLFESHRQSKDRPRVMYCTAGCAFWFWWPLTFDLHCSLWCCWRQKSCFELRRKGEMTHKHMRSCGAPHQHNTFLGRSEDQSKRSLSLSLCKDPTEHVEISHGSVASCQSGETVFDLHSSLGFSPAALGVEPAASY